MVTVRVMCHPLAPRYVSQLGEEVVSVRAVAGESANTLWQMLTSRPS